MIHRRIPTLLLALAPLIASAEVIVQGDKNILLDHNLAANSKNPDTPPSSTPAGDDLILFNNGDLMHGTFAGIEEGLFWERKDIDRPIKFALPSIKKIIFKSTRRLQLAEDISYITLSSGDRIPAQIISLNDKNISLKSPVIGDITLPRNLITKIAPNPFLGELHYLGPYSSNGWLTLEYHKTENEEEEEEEEDKEKEPDPKPSSWIHSGTSFYSQSNTPLILADANLPDTGRISFNIAWKGRIDIIISLHSDLTRAIPAPVEEKEAADEAPDHALNENEEEAKEEEKEPAPLRFEKLSDLRQGNAFQSIPWIHRHQPNQADLFGTGYTLSLRSGYPTLFRNFFDDDGTPQNERLTTTRNNSSLRENEEAQIELRFDKKKSLIMLYINGVYSNQWNDLAGYLGQGTALGFMNHNSSAKVRISELVISTWGGSTDSALSMEHPDRDVVLLTNGTDRLSGKLSHIEKGIAHLKTNYSEIQIPLQDLSLINLNQNALLDLDTDENIKRFEPDPDAITLIYQPFGLIRLTPLSATPHILNGQSPFLGKINVQLDPAILLRFSDDSPDLSDWFDAF